jgi:pyridoxamine 5'-phosphate oxidase
MNQEYLAESTAMQSPFLQFDKWYREHRLEGIRIPGTVYLGTSDLNGRTSLRTVLLKDYDENGFIFFTNYMSRKGEQLNSNRHAALLFYWPEKNRQVRIEGLAEKVEPDISDKYFATRPFLSQIAAWASEQSSIIPGREHLEERFDYFRKKFAGQIVPRPRHWGGYRIIPDWFEFWEDRDNRMHYRLSYTLKDERWNIALLAP